jgi:tRNA threonylcarbamoyladenosine biosynthesis protein TsaE
LRESVTTALKLADEAATMQLGSALAKHLPTILAGWSVLLSGDLGAGKSTIARAVLRALGHNGPVPSPTYTLVEPYDIAGRIIYHVDLYRISSTEELDYLGFDDLHDGLLLVEWPERADGLCERADLFIKLDIDGEGRVAELTPGSERGAGLMQRMALDIS